MKKRNDLKEIFNKPLEKLEEISNDNSWRYFKISVFLILIWMIIIFFDSTYEIRHFYGLYGVGENIFKISKIILAPICGILIYAITIFLMNKNNKKPFHVILATITITKVPLILASCLSLILLINRNLSLLTTAFANLCTVISIVFGYFGCKNLFEDKDLNFIKKYLILQTVYYIMYIVLGIIGIII